MLSPCTRQVTHALLTRPPLTFESLGFIKSPFDLHVLSTPPAFILSQDQTLMFKSSSYQNYLALLFLGSSSIAWLAVLKFYSLKSPDELFWFNSSFGICRVAFLFICQGSMFFVVAFVLSSNSVIISQRCLLVNNFFSSFLKLFHRSKLLFFRGGI